MARFCERPGCSRPAEVIYGFAADRVTVWLESFDVALAARAGVLCRRHADALVVPMGWQLDDRRPVVMPQTSETAVTEVVIESGADANAAPQLFQSPIGRAAPDRATKGRAPRRKRADDTGQLELMVPPGEPDVAAAPAGALDVGTDAVVVEQSEPPIAPWKPEFDQASDLEGLLDVRSPLLARAFRGRSPKP